MPGLNAILNLVSAIDTIGKNLEDGTIAKKPLEENSSKIVEMNREQLYDFGINSLGIEIATYAPYAPYTIKVKREKGQPFDRVTLKDTGAFYRSFEVVFDPIGFYITARDPKTQDLMDKYRPEILGLTSENLSLLVQGDVKTGVIQQIRKELFE